jgi:hypothetical protein
MEVQRGEKAKIIACTKFTCNKAASGYVGEVLHIDGCDSTCVAHLTPANTTAQAVMSTDAGLYVVCGTNIVTLTATSVNSSTNAQNYYLTVFKPIA